MFRELGSRDACAGSKFQLGFYRNVGGWNCQQANNKFCISGPLFLLHPNREIGI